MLTLYGIPNCDTTKKAMVWLKKNHIDYQFHDYKTAGISKKKLEEWLKLQPLEILFNKRSTAWKELSPADQKQADSKAGCITLMEKYNNLIKRPVIEIPGTILVGFNEEEYKKVLLLKP